MGDRVIVKSNLRVKGTHQAPQWLPSQQSKVDFKLQASCAMFHRTYSEVVQNHP